ncbi:MAG: Minf_1886 family protein [Isosphaeraceae bacterium]
MSLRDDLANVLARDPRYSIHAYAFVFEALEYTKTMSRKAQGRLPRRGRQVAPQHVTGQQLCEGARRLALEHFGMMALTVLNLWGLRSTSDLGEVVYNLIASGDLEKTPNDSRADFDNVYDFAEAFRHEVLLESDEAA